MTPAPCLSPVVPTPSAGVRLRPIGLDGAAVTRGLWAERRRVNREVTIPHGLRQLEAAGNLANLRSASVGSGAYIALADDAGSQFPFLDSDVYKWLEAVGWEVGQASDAGLERSADDVIALVESAQRDDGYLNSYFQLTTPRRQFHDLEWGHELYTLGHLVQAAIAWKRAAGDERLLGVATRAVERARAELGPGARELVDGHPGIEMALVELYRETSDERHLELAATLLRRRGRGLLRPDRFGAEYWQDHASVRTAREPVGHAVRQLYLECGAVDLAVETHDTELLDAVRQRWESMVASRTYLTGGLGARQRDEAFGAAFELPPDLAYAETCAAIASVMLAWRLLLATGDAAYADMVERTSLNAVLSGLALDGTHFFYSNPLQVRSGTEPGSGPTSTRRREWYPCACCPPNLMRFLAAFPAMLVTHDADGVSVHQFAASQIRTDAAFGRVELGVETAYPWAGLVEIDVRHAPGTDWTLRARIPDWCRSGVAIVDGEVERPIEPENRELAIRRRWRAGDRLRIQLDMPPRITTPDPRIDAVRGSVAIERGPLVYAVEEADLPDGVALERVEAIPSDQPSLALPDPAFPDMTLLEAEARAVDFPGSRWPYADAGTTRASGHGGRSMKVRAIPYFAWANRRQGAMRVWLPVRLSRPSRK
jgi:DUF1680 family protein